MAKEMDVSCDFIENWLVCTLPNQTMDILLKVHMKTGEHTFWEDVYTCTLKYRRWNNQLRPFRSLKKRVTKIFRKRNSMSYDSRGTSSQSIINNMERDSEERSVVSDNKRDSIHLDWSDLIPIDVEGEYQRVYNSRKRPDARVCMSAPLAAPVATVPSSSSATHKTIKNIVLVRFTPKPNEWGSWQVKKSQCTSSTTATQNSVHKGQGSNQEQQEDEIELAYQPHSLYYSPVHPPEFYEDE